MKRSLLALLTTAGLLLSLMPAPVALAASRERPHRVAPVAPDNVYVVQLLDAPVASYRGGIAGYAATKPARGAKLDPSSTKVQRYVKRSEKRQDDLLASVGASKAKKIYSYTYAMNGFSAVLTRKQATKLLNTPGVASVTADRLNHKATDNSGKFLGLTDRNGGLWADEGLTGEDVVIGIIDTGIWPEHPSFSDQDDLRDRHGKQADRHRVYDAPPATWHGICQTGERWKANDCNNKLIGARYFLDGFGEHGIIDEDYVSARDADGHGTHTSSTAGGNAGVRASIFGIQRGIVSGIAPRARIAIYKALWNDEGGYTSDLAAAIDAAVADGVDIISYSIGSDTAGYDSGDGISFLFANDAGVFASVAAGNAGPAAGTVGSPAGAPWVMTVAASTQDRTFQGTVDLDGARDVKGATITRSLGGRQLVDGATAGSAECIEGELDRRMVRGKIVLCLRGVNGRVEKGQAVKDAGGDGFIIYNQSDDMSLVTDNHVIPGILVNNTDGLRIKAYIAAHGRHARASIDTGVRKRSQGSVMAEFSSRGPNLAAQDILKPDITAPGVNILAGNTPTPFNGAKGQLFQSIGGTSMSTPHIAGLAALLTEAHPDWTPDQVKSALMLTARQDVVKEDFKTKADPFDYGAGHVRPNSALNPGVTMNATFFDYVDFFFGDIDPSDLNVPSIGIAELVNEQTVTRTFTSVDPGSTTWKWSVEGLDGIDVDVDPAPSITLAAGASASWMATFTVDEAPLHEWVFGNIVWKADDGRTVHLPVAVNPDDLAAPASIESEVAGDSDTVQWDVQVGYAGDLNATGYGLAADDLLTDQTVAQDDDQDSATDPFGVGTTWYDVTVPADTLYFAGGVDEPDTTPGGAQDLDVFVYYDADADGFTVDDLVAFAADGDSFEIAEIQDPDPGAYRLVVHGFATPGQAGATFSRHLWVVGGGDGDGGTLVATAGSGDPLSVSPGDTPTISAAASGMTTAGLQYRGIVTYDAGGAPIGRTVLILDR